MYMLYHSYHCTCYSKNQKVLPQKQLESRLNNSIRDKCYRVATKVLDLRKEVLDSRQKVLDWCCKYPSSVKSTQIVTEVLDSRQNYLTRDKKYSNRDKKDSSQVLDSHQNYSTRVKSICHAQKYSTRFKRTKLALKART